MRYLSIFFCCLLMKSTAAQVSSSDAQLAIRALRDVSTRYQGTNHLSFNVTYRYADEKKPTIYLDSLKGNFKLNGSNYWCSLDQTESLSNDQYAVTVFKEDAIIYLHKANRSNNTINPLAALDSLLRNDTSITYRITEKYQQKIIGLYFKEATRYKKMECYVDLKTGWLSKIVSVITADQLYDPSIRSMLEGGSNYVVMETVFSQYQQGHFSDSVFDTNRYFIKAGTQYTTVAPYQSFKIFLGSPEL